MPLQYAYSGFCLLLFLLFQLSFILRTCWTSTLYFLFCFRRTRLASDSLLLLQFGGRFSWPHFIGVPVFATTSLATTYIFLLALQHIYEDFPNALVFFRVRLSFRKKHPVALQLVLVCLPAGGRSGFHVLV